jgi:hypothetical protein
MSEINHFNVFVLFSDDVAANVDHLLVKRIYLKPLVDHLYIVREDFNIKHHNVSKSIRSHPQTSLQVS